VDEDVLERAGPCEEDGCREAQPGLIHVAVCTPQVQGRAQQSALANDLRHDPNQGQPRWSERGARLHFEALRSRERHRPATSAPETAEATSQNSDQAGLPSARCSAAAANAATMPTSAPSIRAIMTGASSEAPSARSRSRSAARAGPSGALACATLTSPTPIRI